MKLSIGFIKGDLALRVSNNEYFFLDEDVYIPLVKEKIKKKLESGDFSLSISTTIFWAMKEACGVRHVFEFPTGRKDLSYGNDPLYRKLERFIFTNENYVNKYNRAQKLNKEQFFGKKEYEKKNSIGKLLQIYYW